MASESPSLLSPQKMPVHVVIRPKGEKGVDTAAFDHSANTDDALYYMTYLIFDRLHSPVLNCDLYWKGKERYVLLQCVPKRGKLPHIFQNLPSPVAGVFKPTCPSLSQTGVIELDDDRMPVSHPTQKVPLVTSV